MRKIIRASVLIMALAAPAFAGYIPNGAIDPPPPNVTQSDNIPNGATSAGDIPNNATGEIPYGITSVSPQASIAEVWISLFFSLIQ
jgi:hypothetical protein